VVVSAIAVAAAAVAVAVALLVVAAPLAEEAAVEAVLPVERSRLW